MNRETANTLAHVAYNIAFNILRPMQFHGNDFNHSTVNYSGAPSWTAINDRSVSYAFGNHAHIDFLDVQPAKIHSLVMHAPTLSEQRSLNADTMVINNNSSVPVSRDYTFESTLSSTQEASTRQALDVSMTTSFSLTTGDSLYGAEATASTSLTTSFSSEWSKSSATTEEYRREDSLSLEVPAGKRYTITNLKKIGNYSQFIECVCDPTFRLRIGSQHDYDIWFDSLEDLYVATGGYSFGSSNNTFKQWFRDNPNSYRLPDIGGVRLTNTINFDNATTGDINITEEDAL